MSDSLITLGRTLGRTSRFAAPVVPSRRIQPALRRFLASDAASWIIPVLLLLVWQAVARAGLLPANVVPAPSDVFDAAWRLTLSGELLDNVGISAKRAGIGFAIGGSLAFAFGLLNGVSKVELFRRVILPGALPSIFVGLRYALGIMWLTLIVAETIAANSGIGYMAMSAREFMQLDVVVLSILLYALLGKLADSVARLLERTMLSWHPAFQAHAKES